MGLAAPKRRSKISHDPNNTNWLNSSSSYGQKIMSAQGWQPGDYLGARNASHSEHYTAANKAHIKIAFREENLGLGAQVGAINAETFGLSVYSGVLSRLNGKSDAEVERQQGALRDAELRTYQANKYGFMNFVRGGLLVGDTIRPNADAKSSTKTSVVKDSSGKQAASSAAHVEEKKRGKGSSKKRRREGHETPSESSELEMKPQPKASLARESPLEPRQGETADNLSTSKKKPEKKLKNHLREEQTSADTADSGSDIAPPSMKQDKRARKEERRRRKEEKRRLKSEKQEMEKEAAAPMHPPTVGNANISAMSGNRHALRHRYIHQKRMASLDPQAMKEIFMLKV